MRKFEQLALNDRPLWLFHNPAGIVYVNVGLDIRSVIYVQNTNTIGISCFRFQ